MVWFGLELGVWPMQSFGCFQGLLGVSRRQRKRAAAEKGIEIEVDGAGYRQRHQKAQAIAEKRRD